ncbi:GTP cyclohydrolase I [Haloarcula californiae tailed virus 1]|uniref:GTP cyclohydrolase I n=1 Tax=Haloarcula californiae tailed virus 1 TaxID=1273746 RepID=R4TMI5_9CAUD|nr:GTP cyclohydrolase [Haloarcula californiae tailed virus 1]AGM11927.1 GTP cyclohydrolase I [Haloarcula californiae tailed virus 1]
MMADDETTTGMDEMKESDVNYEEAVEAAGDFLEALGLDLENEHLKGTPERLARSRAYELFEGLQEDPREHLKRTFEDDESVSDQFVIVDNIQVESMCAHHFLPFRGRAHVGYIPDEEVVGLSKLARVVNGYARRPQVQERLTNQIADAIDEELDPEAVVVFIRAEHECMSCRGIEEAHSATRTTALRGKARDEAHIKDEFYQMLRTGE